jgi:biotin transport system substrate-specific component
MTSVSMPMPLTLADRLFPARSWARDLMLVVAGVALTALLAQISVRLAFTPVPVTGQTLAVLLTGTALGWRRGLASQALYVVLGIVGLPLFAGGSAGLSQLIGPSGGYLLGFMAAAMVSGMLAERGWDRGRRVVLAMILAELAMYVLGVAWLSLYVGGVGRAVVLGFLPFVAGDTVKLLIAMGALPLSWRLLGRA